jgi:hypothetical protein
MAMVPTERARLRNNRANTYDIRRNKMSKEKLEYEGYIGTVEYDEKLDFYTGEVEIDGHIYTYEGDTLEELQEDFEDIIDSIIAFDEMDDEDEE